MRVSVSALGKFHAFHLGRQLQRRGALAAFYSAYPKFKLLREGISSDALKTFPYLHAPYMRLPEFLRLPSVLRQWEFLDRELFDRYVAKNRVSSDVLWALSSSGLYSGREWSTSNSLYVCDRGSCHILEQDLLLKEEHQRWQMPYAGIDRRVIEREIKEYQSSDFIAVPSQFAFRSFVAQGVPASKLRLLQYGVDLSMFTPLTVPPPKYFNVTYVGGGSLQKGIPDLLLAFEAVRGPKRLNLIGSFSSQFVAWLKAHFDLSCVELKGHKDQRQLAWELSGSHVLVLPSIQDGFGMVMAEALACACPVIASEHTGAPDLITDGVDGFIVPIRSPAVIQARLQELADNPTLRFEMSERAIDRARSLQGWDGYGDKVFAFLAEAMDAKGPKWNQ